jgi:hypothetical protein
MIKVDYFIVMNFFVWGITYINKLNKQIIFVAFKVVFTFFCKSISDRKKRLLPIQKYNFFFVDSNPLIPKGRDS